MAMIKEEEWDLAANEASEVFAYHKPCETYFNYGLGPENDGQVPLPYVLNDMAKHEAECD